MGSIDEDLQLDAEENERELQYIMESLPSDLKDKFDSETVLYFMDAIVDYYFASGILDAEPDKDGFVDIDLEKVSEGVCLQAEKDGRGKYDPSEVFFIVQADMDFQEENV